MSKPDGFPKVDNTPAGIKDRLARLLKGQRERQLSGLAGKFFPLEQRGHMLSFYEHEEWLDFFKKFGEVLRILLSLDLFGDNQKLKTECQEVLSLIDSKDTHQDRRYSDLIQKIFNFFLEKRIFPSEKLP
jgi:hypothetical protein